MQLSSPQATEPTGGLEILEKHLVLKAIQRVMIDPGRRKTEAMHPLEVGDTKIDQRKQRQREREGRVEEPKRKEGGLILDFHLKLDKEF